MPALSSESETEELKQSSIMSGASEPDSIEIDVVEAGTVESNTKNRSVAESGLS